ncbi:hypothetical protein DFJ74DRAFT_649831 [Hyaloraphidium curvatum]|nr:hypothetical protein DFJ74DRAFT_649831 [Hyaloraphidium curvatum]
MASIRDAVLSGLLYAVGLFVIGFGIALIRIPVLVPLMGETWAVLVELPLMLFAAWSLAGALLRRTPLSHDGRLLMGAVYLPLLLSFELLLGVSLGGGTVVDIVSAWFHLPGILGLAAQALAALFPSLRPVR